ncbi:MAG TPA: MarR family transcriptional regulator [Actinobacteria bacterium]|nr:MarR family transcriptional regulator [Actinomycetota bacterium]
MLTAHAELIDRLGKEMETATGLPLNWYEVLLHLTEAPEGRLRMHELADTLLLSRSAASRFVDRMERAGLVARVRCEADRRGTYIVLTEAGRRAFAEAAPIHLDGIRRHFADLLDDAEAARLEETMLRLVDAVRSSP